METFYCELCKQEAKRTKMIVENSSGLHRITHSLKYIAEPYFKGKLCKECENKIENRKKEMEKYREKEMAKLVRSLKKKGGEKNG